MRHLYASVVRIERMGMSTLDGMPTMGWNTVPGGEYVECRLDLNFMRPGKDIPQAPVAGKAPDRIGLMFCDSDVPLQAGDRIVTIPGLNDAEPIKGVFEIKVIPDLVQGFSSNHHMEVQILETNQVLDGLWTQEEMELDPNEEIEEP